MNFPFSQRTLALIRAYLIESILGTQPHFTVIHHIAGVQALQNVRYHIGIDMKLRNVMADKFLGRVTQQIELGLIDAQNDSFGIDQVQPHGGVLKEVGQVAFAPLQRLELLAKLVLA